MGMMCAKSMEADMLWVPVNAGHIQREGVQYCMQAFRHVLVHPPHLTAAALAVQGAAFTAGSMHHACRLTEAEHL